MVKRMMQLIEDARERVPEMTVATLRERLASGAQLLLLDVREQHEVEAFGSIDGSVHIPRGFVEMRMERVTTDPHTPIVVYCMVGHRSLLAAQTLTAMGYRDVTSLAGGYDDWAAE